MSMVIGGRFPRRTIKSTVSLCLTGKDNRSFSGHHERVTRGSSRLWCSGRGG